MEELIAALHSLESAVRSLDSFWIALANLALPFTLSIILVIQSNRQNKRNIQLQNEQFKKDVILRRYESIFEIYIAFGQVVRYQKQNQIFLALQIGDHFHAVKFGNELIDRYNALIPNFDLAQLLLGGTDDNLIGVLETIREKQQHACNEYIGYLDNFMESICEKAWDKVHQLYDNIPINDLDLLRSNEEAYDFYLQLTSNKALSLVEKEFKECWDLLTFENYDVFFVKYLRISEICNQEKRIK